MGIARMVGHITYLSARSLNDKFGRRLQFANDIRYRLTEPEFEIENYLRHQAVHHDGLAVQAERQQRPVAQPLQHPVDQGRLYPTPAAGQYARPPGDVQ